MGRPDQQQKKAYKLYWRFGPIVRRQLPGVPDGQSCPAKRSLGVCHIESEQIKNWGHGFSYLNLFGMLPIAALMQ